MLVQAAVFATNLAVVKRYFVDPYLRLRDARAKETEGVQEKASLFNHESSSLERDINERLKTVLEEAGEIRAAIQKQAQKDYDSLVAKARSASEAEVEKVLAQVDESVAVARKQLSLESSKLVPLVCSALLGTK